MAVPLMTVKEAADHFGVSDKTIRKWIKTGKLVAELRPGPTGRQYYVTDQVIDIDPQPGTLERVPSASPSTLELEHKLTLLLPSLLTELSRLTHSLEATHSNPAIPDLTRAIEQLTQRLDRLEQTAATQPTPAPEPAPAAVKRSWWQFWKSPAPRESATN